jgi:hypothetical protein
MSDTPKQRKNEAGRIAAIRASATARKRARMDRFRGETTILATPAPAPKNRVAIECSLSATADEIASLGYERAKALLEGVALVLTAQGRA